METDEDQSVTPFQLQFDKPFPSQIKIAEWNPEKDLLAMVTEDSKILLHRFNWQRLWTVSPGKCITSLCWRPDGKAIAVGLEDGAISLHDVENGKLLRSTKSHSTAVVCLNWEEDGTESENTGIIYEDRTSRFFPPAPRVPRMPGVVPGDTGFMDENEDSYRDLSNSSHQKFNILCSGDKDGSICFSIFGIFPIGKVNIHSFALSNQPVNRQAACRLLDVSIRKVAMAKDLCHLTVICSGELSEDGGETSIFRASGHESLGLHCLKLDTSIFHKRKSELHQVAQQASNIEELTEVIRESISVMCKQWSDAMRTFREKFNSLATLIADYGLESTPQEEFLSLLGGARTSPPVHQFLVNSLGEAGLKRVMKAVCGAGKELQNIVLDHLQPAAEIIVFRMGELRGLSKWRARFKGIGLDETLTDKATEGAGMLLIQVERFMGILSSVVQQFSNFFGWLLKSVKMLMSEPSDQLLPFSSELVILFLKFLYDQDPVNQLLDLSEADQTIVTDKETVERVKELVQFGGFLDTEFLHRTLAKEFQQMESCFEDVFLVPFTTISKKITFEDLLPLFPIASSPRSLSSSFPASISYYQEASETAGTAHQALEEEGLVHYISFTIPDESFGDIRNCVGIVRGWTHDLGSVMERNTSVEAVLLSVPDGYHCVDLCLYKERQIVLLLNESGENSECAGNAYMLIVEASELPFVSISRSTGLNDWNLHELKESVMELEMENEKVRHIPHSVIAPLAVSASRGVACIFAAKRRALVYILEEDEDEVSDVD